MNPTQRAALRALVQTLLPEWGREALLQLLARRLAGAAGPPLTDTVWDPAWTQPETLGWAHQYAQEAAKEQVFQRLLKQGQKVEAGEIPAVTQLFTPAWIVRFLVENSLGRLWLEMHPDSNLRAQMTYLLPADAQPQLVALPALAREIRVLDPACGAMHVGVAAYDLLARCYAEELERGGQPGWPRSPSVSARADIPAAILEQNLYGIDIDPAVLAVANQVLCLKAGVEPRHLYQLPAPLGALDRGVGPAGPFHVVLTNPPYMARKNAEPALGRYLEAEYPEGKGDLYTAFLQRCLDWLAPGGRLGMITQSSFMFIGSYEPLRRWLLARAEVEAVAHLGPGAFAEIGGERVNTAAFLLRRAEEPAGASGLYLRLLDGGEEEKRLALEEALGAPEASPRLFRTPQATFNALPGGPWIYWLPADLRDRYETGERLGERTRFCRGITTADNARFVRYWWEVGLEAIDSTCRSAEQAATSTRRWFPYMKGGGPVRWFGNSMYVVDWADSGRALRGFQQSAVRNLPFQFREGVTYSSVTGGSVTARWMAHGFLFDQASNALFPHDPADLPVLLALLNHPLAAFTADFNPTVNIVEADLNRIPWPRVEREQVAALVDGCTLLARQIDEHNELSPYFRQPPMLDQHDLRARVDRLAHQETSLEGLLDQGLGLSRTGREAIRERVRVVAPALYTPAGLVEAWVSYALGILLGRCRPGSYGGGELLTAHWADLAGLVRPNRRIPLGEVSVVGEVLAILLGAPLNWTLEAFLRRHERTYRKRPVFHLHQGDLTM